MAELADEMDSGLKLAKGSAQQLRATFPEHPLLRFSPDAFDLKDLEGQDALWREMCERFWQQETPYESADGMLVTATVMRNYRTACERAIADKEGDADLGDPST